MNTFIYDYTLLVNMNGKKLDGLQEKYKNVESEYFKAAIIAEVDPTKENKQYEDHLFNQMLYIEEIIKKEEKK